jgi:SNF2 family DNA or RNA helicase
MILPCLNRLKCIANHLELLKPEPASPTYETTRAIAAALLGKQAAVVGGTDPTNRYEILNSTEFCGKLATLDRILLKELALHNKVLIFSRSVRLLKILDSFLKTRANYRLYTGDASAQERKNIVEEFNRDSSVSVLLISLKAGGVGLNLTAANVVILFGKM